MNDPAAGLLHVDAFRSGIGGKKQADGSGPILELVPHRLELVCPHAAVEEPQGVLVKAFLKETLLQVEQRLFVLGEYDQAFIFIQLAFDEEILLNPRHKCFGLGVRLLRQGRQLVGILERSCGRIQVVRAPIHPALKVGGLL